MQTLSFAAKEKINTELTLMNFSKTILAAEKIEGQQLFIQKTLVVAFLAIVFIGVINEIWWMAFGPSAIGYAVLSFREYKTKNQVQKNPRLTLMKFFKKIWAVESQRVLILKTLIFAFVLVLMIGLITNNIAISISACAIAYAVSFFNKYQKYKTKNQNQLLNQVVQHE